MDTTTTTARDQVLRDYNVDANGMIRSPGKFEGEPLFVPYYLGQGLEGFADEDDGTTYTFDLTADDHTMWPELRGMGWSEVLMVSCDDQGFVHAF